MRFYITHQKRFDKLVVEQLMPILATTPSMPRTTETTSSKVPPPSNLSSGQSGGRTGKTVSWSSPNEKHRKQGRPPKHSTTSHPTHTPTQRSRARSPSSPRTPSRSPSPPSFVKGGPRGNRYTDEDKDWLVRYTKWVTKRSDRPMTKTQMAEMLHKKAPHHPVASWMNQFKSGEPVDRLWDKYIRELRLQDDAEDDAFSTATPSADPVDAEYGAAGPSHSGSRPAKQKAQFHYSTRRDPSDDDDDDGDDDRSELSYIPQSDYRRPQRDEGAAAATATQKRVDEMLAEDPGTDEDEAAMGGDGTPYQAPDLRVVARALAAHPEFYGLGYSEQAKFFERNVSGLSSSSCAGRRLFGLG